MLQRTLAVLDVQLALLVVLAALAAGVARAQDADLQEATRLDREASQLYQQGRYADSVRAAQRAVDIRERLLGANNADTAQALDDLAQAYRGTGEYAKALPAAQRAVDIRERVLGPNHPDTAQSLHDLAEVYRAMGDYAAGLPLAQRSLDIREKALGPNHPDTAQSLHCLAELNRSMGEYAKALPLAQRALSIREKARGADHADTAESLNDLALIYLGMGDYAQALAASQRALGMREKTLGADHPLTAESANNLASVYWALKDYKEALPLFERAFRIKEKALGPDHPNTATALNNLAEVYRGMGDYGKALPLAQRAAAIWEKTLGPDHPNTAAALNNVAGFYWTMGDYAQARPLLQRVQAISEKTLGADHPDNARALNLLAAFYRSVGEYDQALAMYRRGLAAEEHTLASVFAVASEEQKLQFIDKTQGHYLAALSLIQRQFRDDPAAVRFGLELVLRHKGIVLDAQARTRDTIAGHLKGDTLQSWQRLNKYRNDLAKLLLSGPGDQSLDAYRKQIEALQESIAGEEQYLSGRSGVVAQELAQRQVTVEMLAGRLPRDSTLVEYVLIRDWDEKRLLWTPTSRYLAFVLTGDGRISLVDLGDAADIDAKVTAALTAINDPNFLKNLSAYTQRTDTALAELYGRLVQPLGAAGTAHGRLIVSPDGELHKVPFAALRTAGNRYLIEDRTVAYVASGRDLMRGKSGVTPTVGMLLAANPAFDDRGVFRPASFRSGPRLRAVRAADYEKAVYPPLPGTAEEAQAIPPLLKGTKKVLMGKDATESAVRATRSPQVLHLATHGFFLKDRVEDQSLPDPLSRGRRLFRGGEANGPMVRSGLALAGANHADEVSEGDDGILTALEVSGMDLYGTDLAVLSACETALGEVRAGEGVYGLRRAFVLAGAKNLVMSLWPVSDKVTRDLMERFYQAYGAGDHVADALQKAQLETITQLRDLTRNSAQGEPLAPVNLWGPFIVQTTGG